jgi:hypothetical protein
VVMAGKGLRVKECKLSIMQLDRFRARKQDNVDRLSGISVKRLADKSSDCRVFANGARLVDEMLVRALSARLKCLRNRHLVGGNQPNDKRLDELPPGVVDRTLDAELPDEGWAHCSCRKCWQTHGESRPASKVMCCVGGGGMTWSLPLSVPSFSGWSYACALQWAIAEGMLIAQVVRA